MEKFVNAYANVAMASLAKAFEDIKPRKLKIDSTLESKISVFKRILSENILEIILRNSSNPESIGLKYEVNKGFNFSTKDNSMKLTLVQESEFNSDNIKITKGKLSKGMKAYFLLLSLPSFAVSELTYENFCLKEEWESLGFDKGTFDFCREFYHNNNSSPPYERFGSLIKSLINEDVFIISFKDKPLLEEIGSKHICDKNNHKRNLCHTFIYLFSAAKNFSSKNSDGLDVLGSYFLREFQNPSPNVNDSSINFFESLTDEYKAQYARILETGVLEEAISLNQKLSNRKLNIAINSGKPFKDMVSTYRGFVFGNSPLFCTYNTDTEETICFVPESFVHKDFPILNGMKKIDNSIFTNLEITSQELISPEVLRRKVDEATSLMLVNYELG